MHEGGLPALEEDGELGRSVASSSVRFAASLQKRTVLDLGRKEDPTRWMSPQDINSITKASSEAMCMTGSNWRCSNVPRYLCRVLAKHDENMPELR